MSIYLGIDQETFLFSFQLFQCLEIIRMLYSFKNKNQFMLHVSV